MSAWNSKPFGNDSALDWLSELECTNDVGQLISKTVKRIDADWGGDSDQAEEAIAAISFIAASATDPIGSISQTAKKLIAVRGYVPTEELISASLLALDKISTESELRDLWVECGSLECWLTQLEKLSVSLRNAIAKGLPTREPKKSGVPRSLYKLIEYYASEPSDAIRAKIRSKVGAIDPNRATAETSWTSPLSLAARYGLLEETQDLISRGANIEASKPDPFVAACVNGHVHVAELLRKNGATVFSKVDRRAVEGYSNALDEIVLNQYRIRGIEPKPHGYTYCLALFAVARDGGKPGIEYLASLGADLNQADLNDENLIHKACESGNLDILRHLIASGLDPKRTKGKFAESPLHYAVRACKIEAVSLLLESGADPNHIDKFEGGEHQWYETPLDICEDEKTKNLLRKFGGKSALEIMMRSKG